MRSGEGGAASDGDGATPDGGVGENGGCCECHGSAGKYAAWLIILYGCGFFIFYVLPFSEKIIFLVLCVRSAKK